jgi:FKBP-type peptidyl-prolyl cis-trans isomerase
VTQEFRLGNSIENPAWLYILQQCGKGDKVKFMMDPEIARSELKKLIPEDVSVFFEFEIMDIQAPSFLPVEFVTPIKFDNGIKISLVNEGKGEALDSADVAFVHYTGFTIDSLGNKKVFDSSFDKGVPFEIQIGSGKVIKGWELGLLGRRENDQFRLEIPSDLGYGKRGVPPLIYQDETLYFDIYVAKTIKLQKSE